MTNPSAQEKYAELIALAQLYIFQEYKPGQWINSDSDTFKLFREYALQNQPKGQSAPVVNAPTLPQQSPTPTPPSLPKMQTATPPPLEPIKTQSITPSTQEPVKTQAATVAPPEPQKTGTPHPSPTKPVESNKKPPKEAKKFELEPMPEAQPVDYEDLKKIVTEKFPHVKFIEEPPVEPSKAQTAEQGQSSVIILTYHENGPAMEFMQNLTKAVHAKLATAEMISANQIEKEGGWDKLLSRKALRLIISSYAGAQALPGLMKHFHESPKKGLHHLGKVPLCLLPDVAVYLKEPQLKIPLWKSIQALLNDGK